MKYLVIYTVFGIVCLLLVKGYTEHYRKEIVDLKEEIAERDVIIQKLSVENQYMERKIEEDGVWKSFWEEVRLSVDNLTDMVNIIEFINNTMNKLVIVIMFFCYIVNINKKMKGVINWIIERMGVRFDNGCSFV